jgi:hypothetical protein
MFEQRIIDLIERTIDLNFSARVVRRITLLIRLLLIFAFTFVIFRLAPTMADELTPAPITEVTSSPSAEPSPSISESPSPQASGSPAPASNPSEEPIAPVPSGSASPSASPTAATALTNQNMQIRIPTSLLVDPRARTTSISEVSISGPDHILVCARSTSLISDVYLKNVADSEFGDENLVAGDQTSNLMVTGNVDQVLTILNSARGIRVSSPLGTIANQSILFKFVATSASTLDSKLCSKATAANTRTLSFRELGLQIEMKKGDLSLKQ